MKGFRSCQNRFQIGYLHRRRAEQEKKGDSEKNSLSYDSSSAAPIKVSDGDFFILEIKLGIRALSSSNGTPRHGRNGRVPWRLIGRLSRVSDSEEGFSGGCADRSSQSRKMGARGRSGFGSRATRPSYVVVGCGSGVLKCDEIFRRNIRYSPFFVNTIRDF